MKNKSKSVSLRNGAPQRLVKVIAECNVSYNSFIGEFVPQLGYSKKIGVILFCEYLEKRNLLAQFAFGFGCSVSLGESTLTVHPISKETGWTKVLNCSNQIIAKFFSDFAQDEPILPEEGVYFVTVRKFNSTDFEEIGVLEITSENRARLSNIVKSVLLIIPGYYPFSDGENISFDIESPNVRINDGVKNILLEKLPMTQ